MLLLSLLNCYYYTGCIAPVVVVTSVFRSTSWHSTLLTLLTAYFLRSDCLLTTVSITGRSRHQTIACSCSRIQTSCSQLNHIQTFCCFIQGRPSQAVRYTSSSLLSHATHPLLDIYRYWSTEELGRHATKPTTGTISKCRDITFSYYSIDQKFYCFLTITAASIANVLSIYVSISQQQASTIINLRDSSLVSHPTAALWFSRQIYSCVYWPISLIRIVPR